VLGPLGARLGGDGRLAPALEGRPRPLVIPIPMRRASRRERGYDQALELARGLAHSRGLALAPGALRRRRQPLRAQVGAPGHQRLRQLRGSFRAGSRVGGERVLLVDDVMSSGATVDAAARALRCAGALRVDVIVLAT
jgi:predicted amidophosphoribosyltransferase